MNREKDIDLGLASVRAETAKASQDEEKIHTVLKSTVRKKVCRDETSALIVKPQVVTLYLSGLDIIIAGNYYYMTHVYSPLYLQLLPEPSLKQAQTLQPLPIFASSKNNRALRYDCTI